MTLRKSAAAAAVATILGTTVVPQAAQAKIYDFSVSGWFTLLTRNGAPLPNFDLPQEQGRTPITGAMTFDEATGVGTGTINAFDYFGNNGLGPTAAFSAKAIIFEAIGDGFGGPGTLLLGNMLFDWGGNRNAPLSVVMDASGLFGALSGGLKVGETISGTGAMPAVDGSYGTHGYLSYGPSPIATTTFDTTALPYCHFGACLGVNPSGGIPLVTDYSVNQHLTDISVANGGATVFGIGGSPIQDGPFFTHNINLDFTSMTLQPVPVPAAVWLFASGLLGLIGVARRRKN